MQSKWLCLDEFRDCTLDVFTLAVWFKKSASPGWPFTRDFSLVWKTGFERDVEEERWDWGRIESCLVIILNLFGKLPIARYIFRKNILERS